MGCKIKISNGSATVIGASLRGTDVDLKHTPDLAPTVAVVAAFADSPSTIRGTSHIRVKESDRAAVIVRELNKIGALAELNQDHIKITPAAKRPALVKTDGDHRVAMAFSIAALKIEGLTIDDRDCVKKSYPGFFDDLNTLLGKK